MITLPTVRETLTVGGQVLTDLDNLIILVAERHTGSYSTFRDCSTATTAGYAVTAAKTFYIKAARLIVQVAAAAPLSLGYADTDVGFGGGAPTTPKFFADGGNTLTIPHFTGATVGTFEQGFGKGLQVPATKFPTLQAIAGPTCALYLFGYER